MRGQARKHGNQRRRGRRASAPSAALAVAALVALAGYRAEAAQPPVPPEPAVAAPTPEPPHAFDVPAEPLERALDAFSVQCGCVVRYSPAAIAGRASAAVNETTGPAEALRRLLGDAFTVRPVGPRTLQIDLARAPRTIGIVGATGSDYVETRPGVGKYLRPLLDTPQTIVEVPQQLIADQNATTLHDALRNVSGISLAAGEGGSQGDSLTIRGFDAKDDFYLDGQRDFGNYYRDPFDLERVEVIMGPASMLFGHGEGGGIVNQVSKSAALTNFDDVTLTAGTDAMLRFTLDDNVQLAPTTAFRLNAMAERTNTADRDVTMGKRYGLAPSVTFGLGTPNRLTFSLYTQSDDAVPDYGLPYIDDRPAAVPRTNFYGFADQDRLEDRIGIGTIAFDHDFSDSFTLHSQLRIASYEREFSASNAVTPSPQPVPGTPSADITVGRTTHERNGTDAFFQAQTYLTKHFGTGPLANTLMFGFEATRETSHETIYSVTGLPTTNLLDPDPDQPYTYTSLVPHTDNHVTADTLAFFVADSLPISRLFEFDSGLRSDTFDARNDEYVSSTTAVQDVGKLSPQAAIVYKPAPNGTVYLAYDTSFQPSADALSLTSAQIVAPASNATYEFGTKWNLSDRRLTVTASIFNSIMRNAHITEPDGSVLPVGTERSNGFQTQIQGSLTPRWRLSAGYTLLETDVLAYVLSTQPGIVGTHIPNAPTGSASVWTTYQFPGLKAGFGAEGLSVRQASIGVDTATGSPILVPGYVRFDAELSRRLSPAATLQLNAYNLLNTAYFDEIHPDHVVPGAGRSVALELRLRTR